MRVYAYRCTEEDVPSGPFVGRIRLDGSWHPVIFYGPSEGSVRTQAQTWWEDEVSKADKRKGPRAPKPPAGDVGEVL